MSGETSTATQDSTSSSKTRPPSAERGRRPGAEEVPATLVPESGWHFLHLFYRVDRDRLRGYSEDERRAGREALVEALGTRKPGAVDQLQCFAVPGHKADFGVMLAGPDLKALHAVETAIEASPLGGALVPTYSFYSITEVSEYVPDVEQYGAILRDRQKLDPESEMFKAKVAAYAERLGPMNKHRLYPEFPDWPCVCFYPMSKARDGDQNWYMLPFEARSELMGGHSRSGMLFAGKVSQVITASTGLDDWEWGVTLWSRNPVYIKDIVYTMRYDESSAKYGLFGEFYFGYIVPPRELVETLRI